MRDVRWRAWQRWQAAAGPWRGWSVCLPLTAPYDADHRVARPESYALTHLLVRQLRNARPTFVILDVAPELGVSVAAELHRAQLAHVVLVLPRWPYSDAVLPCDALIAALLRTSQWISQPQHLRNVVFVLDAERKRPLRKRLVTSVDNRYDISTNDLPNLAALRTAGIQRIVKIQ